MARRASTATAPQSARLQMATSMRPRTAIPTRTPGAAGRTPTEANPAHQAGVRRKRAAGRRPSAVIAGDGDRSRKAPVVRQVEAAVVAGAVVEGEPSTRWQLVTLWFVNGSKSRRIGGSYVARKTQSRSYKQVLIAGGDHPAGGVQQV